VLTAAHCFCVADRGGVCRWNDQKKGDRLEGGHYAWVGGSRGSSVAYNVTGVVTVISPGYSSDYRCRPPTRRGLCSLRKLNEPIYERNFPEAVYRAAKVTIHPNYVRNIRDQADIALVTKNDKQSTCSDQAGQEHKV
jgi:hypothetical protein